jgi:hypothetical protein
VNSPQPPREVLQGNKWQNQATAMGEASAMADGDSGDAPVEAEIETGADDFMRVVYWIFIMSGVYQATVVSPNINLLGLATVMTLITTGYKIWAGIL